MDQNNNHYSELKRKIVHVFTILYPVLYNTLSHNLALLISGLLVLLDILLETVRLTFPSVNKFILKNLSGIYRKHEENNISTLIWTLSGGFLTMFMFGDVKNKTVATVALLYMVFGDSTAGLIGTWFGKTKIGFGKKTLEGSLSCFVACFICGIIFLPWHVAIIGAAVATIIELLPLPLNDNFWLPVLSGFTLTFLKMQFMPNG
jgi:dolichol kinase